MKNYIKYLTILFVSLMFTSCLVEDDGAIYNDNDKGPNLAGFTDSSTNIGGIANGEEYVFDLQMEVKGPTVNAMNSDVTVTVSADPSSTAIEGTHFMFPSNSITLTRGDNYYDSLQITMLSEGIVAPLDEAPVLYLNVTDASGDNVINNGKPLKITFNYLCFSNLAGTYDAVMVYTAYDGSVSNYTFTDVWTETGIGEYRTTEVGHWIGGLGVGTPGMTVVDVCNEIIINGQNLVDYYGNWVDDLGVHGTYNPDNETITVDYSICYPAGADNCRYYNVVYTRQ